MNELQIFENPDFGKIRAIEIDGEAWLVGKDVAELLGYANPNEALADHVDDEDKLNSKTLMSLGQRGGWFINESGLYSLVLQSKLPNAKKFRRWVTSEVLPSIRKHGGYIVGQESETDEALMARALTVAQRVLSERDAKIATLTSENEVLRPKGEYFDALVDRGTLTNFRETAKEFGIGQKELISFLLDKGYIYRNQKGHLLPTAEKGDGLFEVKECIAHRSEWSGVQTLITPKGRKTFRLLMPLHEENKAHKSKKHKR